MKFERATIATGDTDEDLVLHLDGLDVAEAGDFARGLVEGLDGADAYVRFAFDVWRWRREPVDRYLKRCGGTDRTVSVHAEEDRGWLRSTFHVSLKARSGRPLWRLLAVMLKDLDRIGRGWSVHAPRLK